MDRQQVLDGREQRGPLPPPRVGSRVVEPPVARPERDVASRETRRRQAPADALDRRGGTDRGRKGPVWVLIARVTGEVGDEVLDGRPARLDADRAVRVDGPGDALDLVSPEHDTVGLVLEVGWEHLDHVATHAERARREVEIVAVVEHVELGGLSSVNFTIEAEGDIPEGGLEFVLNSDTNLFGLFRI